MENGFENKDGFENHPETEGKTGDTEYCSQDQYVTESTENSSSEKEAAFGTDYNSSGVQQSGQYSDTSWQQEASGRQSARQQGSYQAPDYGYQPGGQRNDNRQYYQDNNQGFHNEYQEQGGYFNGGQNGNRKKPHHTGKKIAVIAGCAILFGVIAAAGVKGIDMLISGRQDDAALLEEQQQSEDRQENRQENSIQEENGIVSNTQTQSGSPAVSGEQAVPGIVENAMPSMVSIDCKITETYNYFGRDYSQNATGSGSGFLIEENENELFIATNNHVVEGAKSIEITFIDGTKAEATTKGTDAAADLAVVSVKKSDLKKDTMKQIRVASLGESDNVKLGEMVVAIGNALGYGQSVTVGYVSAKDREVTVSSGETMVLLQADAAINPGNSGGALLNLKGEVIGIPTIKYADSTVEGMGFAIPISRANPILDELVKREVLTEEERGYLGVSCRDVTSEANELYNIPIGVYVSELSEDGAAKKAGVQIGDIITALNGVETSSKEAFAEKVHSYRIGTEITLTIQRSHNGKYEEMEIKAKLKGKSTMEGLPGSEDSYSEGSSSQNPGNDGNADGEGSFGSGSSGNPGDSSGNGGYEDGSEEDFYEFFRDFFN